MSEHTTMTDNDENVTQRGNARVIDRTSRGVGLDLSCRSDDADEEHDDDEREIPAENAETKAELRSALARAAKRGDREELKRVETQVLPRDMPPQASEKEKTVVAWAVLHPTANLRKIADGTGESVGFARMCMNRYLDSHASVAKYADEDTSGSEATATLMTEKTGDDGDVQTSRTGRWVVPLPLPPEFGEKNRTESIRTVIALARWYPDEPMTQAVSEYVGKSKSYAKEMVASRWPDHPQISDSPPESYRAPGYDGETDGVSVCPECSEPFENGIGLYYHRESVHGGTNIGELVENGIMPSDLDEALGVENPVSHEPTDDDGEVYPCEVCGETFDNPQAISGHMNAHDEAEREAAQADENTGNAEPSNDLSEPGIGGPGPNVSGTEPTNDLSETNETNETNEADTDVRDWSGYHAVCGTCDKTFTDPTEFDAHREAEHPNTLPNASETDTHARDVLEDVAQTAETLYRGSADENVRKALHEALRPLRESDIDVNGGIQ